MTPAYVVVDAYYGVTYSTDREGHLLTAQSAAETADRLNSLMPPDQRDYAVYELVRAA